MSHITKDGTLINPMTELLELKFQEYCVLEQEYQDDKSSFPKGKLQKLNNLRELMVKELPEKFF